MYPRAERVLKRQRRSCECRSGETVLPFVLRRERVFEVERDRSRERALARLRALKKPLPKGFRFDRDEAKPLRQMRILLDENFPADFATCWQNMRLQTRIVAVGLASRTGPERCMDALLVSMWIEKRTALQGKCVWTQRIAGYFIVGTWINVRRTTSLLIRLKLYG